jgi:hypothetical protein
MIVEKQMESRLAGETEVLGANLPQHHFCPSQNPTCPDPGLNAGRRGGKPATNRLSYGAAFFYLTVQTKITVFWIVTPCILVDIYGRTEGTYCLHLQGSQKTQVELSSETSVKN